MSNAGKCPRCWGANTMVKESGYGPRPLYSCNDCQYTAHFARWQLLQRDGSAMLPSVAKLREQLKDMTEAFSASMARAKRGMIIDEFTYPTWEEQAAEILSELESEER
jgi:transposase-like protein